MFQRRPRRFRHRSNGRNNHHRGSRDVQGKLRSNLFLNSNNKNNHRGNQSAEKLLENKDTLKQEVKKYLKIFKNHPYIFNLGHGVLPETNPNMVEYLIKFIKDN